MERAEIYALCCPDTGDVRYIGKANDSAKRFKGHLRDACRRQTPVYNWITSLRKRGENPVLRILMVTEDWRAHEKAMIVQYREEGARLLNVAEGGDEPYCSTEQRAANGRKNAMKVHGDPVSRRIWELKQMLGGAIRRGEVNEATKAKIREAAIRKPHIFGLWANI